jgi:hypothetical protein
MALSRWVGRAMQARSGPVLGALASGRKRAREARRRLRAGLTSALLVATSRCATDLTKTLASRSHTRQAIRGLEKRGSAACCRRSHR